MDYAGFVDPTGLSDLWNGAIYAADGDSFNAAISIASILPGGDVAKAARIATKKAGGQISRNCVDEMNRILKERGGERFNPFAGMNVRGNHWAVRNADGTVTDTTIFQQFKEYIGHYPEQFEHLKGTDTFDDATYRDLIDALTPHMKNNGDVIFLERRP